MSADHDLAVVGAGPAGLAAATCAAGSGLDVVLLDEQPAPGGRVYLNVEGLAEARSDDLRLLGARYRAGLSLAASFRASGARYRPETAVWMIEADGSSGATLGLRDAASASLLSARRVVVAAGAMERAVPVPGWTLPGVMTVGAAQTLLKASALVPEMPPVSVGSGPQVRLYAAQLLAIGGAIAAILDTTPPGNRVKALPRLPGLIGHLGALRQGLSWQRALKAAGVAVFKGAREIEATGDGRVEAVEFLSGGRRRRIETRLLLLHEGVVPDHHLAMSAGCAMAWDEDGWYWHTVTDHWGVSSVETIAVVGDCAGIGGAEAAAHGARVAILDLAETDPLGAAAEVGPGHLGYVCDVRDRAACTTTVDEIAERFGRIDVLIGNAGIVHGTPILDIAQDEYDEILDTNLRGKFQMSQAAIPHMRAQGSGSIVLVSSIAGQVGGRLLGSAHYATAKSGIRTKAIAPGVIDNDFTKGRVTREIKDEIAK